MVFQMSSHDGPNNFGLCLKKMEPQPKIWIYGPKLSTLGFPSQKMAYHMIETASHRRSEGFQSYLRIRGRYDLIKLTTSETKKWGLCEHSVKKSDLGGKNGPKSAMAAAWKPLCIAVNTGS